MVGEEESIEATEEAKIVAGEISRRNYNWTDGYEESFAETMDRLSYFPKQKAIYKVGSKHILKICKEAGAKDPIWEELDLDPEEISNIIHCAEKIKNIMSY